MKKRLIVYFDNEPELYEWLRKESYETEKSMSEIVRELIREASK